MSVPVVPAAAPPTLRPPAPRRGRWSPLLAAAAVLAGVAAAAAGLAAPAWAAGLLPPANPSHNYPDPLSGSILCSWDGKTLTGPCDLVAGQLQPDAARIRALYVHAIDGARATEGLGPLVLPADYGSLSLPQRLMVLMNQERTARGLPPVLGRLSLLDGLALGGAQGNADPQFPAGWRAAGGSVWGEGYGATSIWFDWMYYDGWGGSQTTTPNLDCSGPAATGCWGHRDILLDNWGTQPLAGIATTEEPNGQQVSAAIILSAMPSGGVAALPGPLLPAAPVATSASPPAAGAGAPVVSGLSPSGGPPSGGTQVTVSGTGFTGATGVEFGGVPAPATVVSNAEIVTTSPPGNGSVDVLVLTPGGDSTPVPADVFTYASSAPTGGSPAGATAPTTPPFGDLAGYGWAQAAIDDLAARGVLRGVAPGVFDPAGVLSRAQLAVLLTRLFNLPPPAQPIPFTDVRPGSWDYAGAEAAAPYVGYPPPPPSGAPSFDPGTPVDRQGVAAALVRLLEARGSLQPISPTAAATALASVPDAAAIAPPLRTAVATVLTAGLMTGFPGGDFGPTDPLTRAQAAVLLNRLGSYLPH